MKKLILAAAAICFIVIGFTANSREQAPTAAPKIETVKKQQQDVNALQGTSASKQTASWD